MAFDLYNTLTSRKEPFAPADPSHARIYVCGPTVYDFSHLGHARCYVVYDVLVRHLRASGMKVTYVRNITDIDDKIIKRAGESGEAPIALAERFAAAYAEDMGRIGNLTPDVEPKVSDHLDEIRAMIGQLIDKGAAYASAGDVYFSVEACPDYGKLSHRKLDQMAAGASGRTGDAEAERKRHPADFALWKGAKPGELAWPSPWGEGRPGWHIECSAMSMRYLGETFDLHGGGLDLVFPHHENEIAQSECATGKLFARHWMHNGFVEVDKEKMSKSLGNFFTARELFERVEPEAIRLVMLTVHYRSPLNLDWTLDGAGNIQGFPQFEEAERRIEYLYATRLRLDELPKERIAPQGPVPAAIADVVARVGRALDDDLNMPIAIAQANDFLSAVNELCDAATRKKGTASAAAVERALEGFAHLGRVLGIGEQDAQQVLSRIWTRRALARGLTPDAIRARIDERAEARAAKDFARADAVRDALLAQGVQLLDRPDGTSWRVA